MTISARSAGVFLFVPLLCVSIILKIESLHNIVRYWKIDLRMFFDYDLLKT